LFEQATVQPGRVRVVKAASRRGHGRTAQRQEGGLELPGRIDPGVAGLDWLWPPAAGAGAGAHDRRSWRPATAGELEELSFFSLLWLRLSARATSTLRARADAVGELKSR